MAISMIHARLMRPLCCLALILPPLAQAAADGPHWQYSGAYGPAQWGRMRAEYAQCDRGRRQSPVDIVATRPAPTPAPLKFEYRSAPLRIVNDGHTVRVRFAAGRDASALHMGKERLTLQQFHFHTPGGDRLRGEEFPMAMHLLHKSRSGRLVSLVLLFRLGAENPALAELLPHMPAAGQAEQTVANVRVDPARLLPADQGYYAYEGSLTAPPCTEGVLWLVMRQPLELSAAQLADLHKLFADNARPVQPLFGRIVTEHR